MAARTPLIAANWKMHKTIEETERFLAEYLPNAPGDEVAVVVCPPFTSLKTAVEHSAQSRLQVAAQNMHEEAEGAFTGEVSASMLTELGVDAALLGHSERRQHFGETDEALARKVPAALAAGLIPILCIGESEAEREGGDTETVLSQQVAADLEGVDADRLADIVIAYEPIWAIGTGKTATNEQAQEAIAFIRGLIAARDGGAGEAIRILYGGSMKPDNAAELLAQPDIDGGLVGGASLDPSDFAAIVGAVP